MESIWDKDGLRYLDDSGTSVAKAVVEVSDGVAVITHTFVDDSLRGQGIAAKLMEETVDHIRRNGLKARPVCSYAQRWFTEHQEHYDLLYWSCDSNRI